MLGRYWYVEPVKHLAGRFGLSENNVKVILHPQPGPAERISGKRKG